MSTPKFMVWKKQRTQEIGIRTAQGVCRADMLALIVRQGMILAAVIVGLADIPARRATQIDPLIALRYE